MYIGELLRIGSMIIFHSDLCYVDTTNMAARKAARKALLNCSTLLALSLLVSLFIGPEQRSLRTVEDESRLQSNSAHYLKISTRNLCQRPRGKRYLTGRIPHAPNSTSGFQIERRIVLSGDIEANPGPKAKRAPKCPCKKCERGVKNNQDAILCIECNTWSHVKCIGMSKPMFQYYLNHPNIDWTCDCCALPGFTDSFLAEETQVHVDAAVECEPTTDPAIQLEAEKNAEPVPEPYASSHHWFEANISRYFKSHIKIAHLNINAVYNKMDEVKEMLNRKMFDILFLAETKIDNTVSDAFLSHPGFRLIRRDRKKGAGGLIAYVRDDMSVYRRRKLEPDKKKQVRADQLPWISPGILREITYRNRLYKRHKRNSSASTWEAFRKQRNKVTWLKRQGMKAFYRDASTNAKNHG